MIKPFRDRAHAGKQLSLALHEHAIDPGAIVLALPRGGVPVGFAVAHALGLALDILLVRKLGMPGQEEFAIGAVASGGVRVVQRGVLQHAGITPAMLEEMCTRELAEIDRRERRYRGGRPAPPLAARTVILVDDGLATGSSMRAAIALARAQAPARLLAAVPVGAADTCAVLAAEVDELICLVRPHPFRAVSQWYRQFDQTTDDEVIDLLAQAWCEQEPRERASHS
ncbi:phosphoribosyltransferase [Massilia sp. TSP1-1-2]|uniref:phosphoribosyltransferase n=1 Tax=unclassified Massilia TaxID=2609279 RepID=UPI003CE8141B